MYIYKMYRIINVKRITSPRARIYWAYIIPALFLLSPPIRSRYHAGALLIKTLTDSDTFIYFYETMNRQFQELCEI